jgi:hypothetical protein
MWHAPRMVPSAEQFFTSTDLPITGRRTSTERLQVYAAPFLLSQIRMESYSRMRAEYEFMLATMSLFFNEGSSILPLLNRPML